MKTKLTKGILLILSLLCILCVPVTPVYAAQQGTDGSELQVVKAEQLEIQLGTSWSGVEFQLKTDAGVYPGTVKVGTDGVLRLEIGGSSQYILTCMNSSTSIPEPEDVATQLDVQAALKAAKQKASPCVIKGIDAMIQMAEGRSSKEIGNEFGVSANLVCAWVSKARKYLKSRPEILALKGV